MLLPNVSAKQPLCVVDFCDRPFPHFQREAACKGRVRMAPKGAKRKFEPTEWTDIDVSGLLFQLTAAGMVHFKWEGSSKQTLTLTKDEDVQDAPRRVRARVNNDPTAKAAAQARAAAEAKAAVRAAKAAAKAAAKTATREEPAEQAQTQSGNSVVFPLP